MRNQTLLDGRLMLQPCRWDHFCKVAIFTDRIRNIGEGNVFTGVCLHTEGECTFRMHPPWMHPILQWIHLLLPSPADRRSTGGRYASCWNAFLFYFTFIPLLRPLRWNSHSTCPHPPYRTDRQTENIHFATPLVGGN